jgi:hypothetical protein
VIVAGVVAGAAGLVAAPPAVAGGAVQANDPSVQPTVALDRFSFDFGTVGLSEESDAQTVHVKNTGTLPVTVTDVQLDNEEDFGAATDCLAMTADGRAAPKVLMPGATCTIATVFAPVHVGTRHGTISVVDDAADAPQTVGLHGIGTSGYYLVEANGTVTPYGDGVPMTGTRPTTTSPAVSAAATVTGEGLWLTGADGAVSTAGDAKPFGSLQGRTLNRPIVGVASTYDSGGFWLVGTDGGVFAFGDAQFLGSTGSIRLNKPIVGMAATPTGNGYWMVATDGGIFAFGDAKFYGSMGSVVLNKPIVGMAPTASGHGYWMVASDGGIFAFGDARFYGSMGGRPMNKTIIGMATSPTGGGYWMVASDGGIFSFGDSLFYGSLAGAGVHNVVAIAPADPPLASSTA